MEELIIKSEGVSAFLFRRRERFAPEGLASQKGVEQSQPGEGGAGGQPASQGLAPDGFDLDFPAGEKKSTRLEGLVRPPSEG